MNTGKPETEDLQFLKKLIARSESGFQEYKKILVLWAGIIFFNGLMSQILIIAHLTIFIPGMAGRLGRPSAWSMKPGAPSPRQTSKTINCCARKCGS